MRLAFTVLGEPKAWQRARLSKTGHHFTEKKTRSWSYECADLAAYHAIAQHFPRAFKGPCALNLAFVFQRPQNRFRKCDPDGRMWRETGKKDADNCGKLVMDSLQKAGVFVDDKQVVDLHVLLLWTARDEAPCVEIECLTLDGAFLCDTNQLEAVEPFPARNRGAFR